MNPPTDALSPAKGPRPDRLAEGAESTVWCESGVHPLQSFLTRTVAAARTVGFRLLSEQAYSHSVEDDGTEEGRRETFWIWAAGQAVTFRPNFAEETLTLKQFASRFQDLDWVKANPDHPISHMRWYYEVLQRTLAEVRELGTCEKIVRQVPGSKLFCLIPPDATEEERAELIDEMNRLIGG